MTFDRRIFLGSSLIGAGGAAMWSPLAGSTPPSGSVAPLPLAGNPVVRTRDGSVRGSQVGRIASFLGIPYGASTAGKNRFRRMQPVEKWDGVRDAFSFGPAVPFATPAFFERSWAGNESRYLLYYDWLHQDYSEDCLRLNLWAPQGSGNKRRPVMVYMHGGGLTAGSGHSLPSYIGHNLAERGDVVVVTHNHRLNLFGFLDLSSFGGRWEETANLGLLDIVSVLRWVRDNIDAFGGDPGNVTIFGQSGGGMKVSALMAMPEACGLFHKAIVQSGSPGILPASGKDQARANAELVLAALDVPANQLDRLETLSTADLVKANTAKGVGWSYSLDVPSLPVAPGSAAAAAQSVPLMVGTNLNEFISAPDNPKISGMTDAELLSQAKERFGEDGVAAAKSYTREYAGRPAGEIWGALNVGRIRDAALAQSANNFAVTRKSWHYLFAWRTPVLGGTPGTFHSAEIAFVFNNADLCVNQTGGSPEAVGLAHQMSDAWVAFARKGDPNHSGLAAWPAFGAAQNVMVFDKTCRVVANPEAEGRAILRDQLARHPLF